MTFLALLFILLVYIFVMLGMPRKMPKPPWWFAAAAGAAFSAAVIVAVLFWGEHSKDTSQIAWIGLEGRRAEDVVPCLAHSAEDLGTQVAGEVVTSHRERTGPVDPADGRGRHGTPRLEARRRPARRLRGDSPYSQDRMARRS